MAATRQNIALIVSLCVVAHMLPIVLCEIGSQATPVNYKPIPNKTPPCSNNGQKNCVTHRPPANKYRRPCNPSDHCRGGQKPPGSQNMNKAQVSAAAKQFGFLDHSLFHLVLQFIAVWAIFLYLKL